MDLPSGEIILEYDTYIVHGLVTSYELGFHEDRFETRAKMFVNRSVGLENYMAAITPYTVGNIKINGKEMTGYISNVTYREHPVFGETVAGDIYSHPLGSRECEVEFIIYGNLSELLEEQKNSEKIIEVSRFELMDL